jgi:hypothetical protein
MRETIIKLSITFDGVEYRNVKGARSLIRVDDDTTREQVGDALALAAENAVELFLNTHYPDGD